MPLILLLLAAPPAAAHGPLAARAENWPVALGAALMAAAWVMYEAGARRAPPRPGRRAAFHAALAVAALAVFGPFDTWAETSTAMHMLQHMLFMVVIAPLAVLAAPLPQWRAVLGRRLDRVWTALARCGRQPLAMALVHGALIWIWHAPRPYLLALERPGWHMLEHASFVLSAWLFWWSALRPGRRRAPQALLALLLTLMHTGLLGALLTFGRTSFYGAGRSLEDQQLAGLLMWVPGGLLYLAGAAWIAWRWLGPELPGPEFSRPGPPGVRGDCRR